MTQQVFFQVFCSCGWEASRGFFPQNGDFPEDFPIFEEEENKVDFPQFFENAEVQGGFFPQFAVA